MAWLHIGHNIVHCKRDTGAHFFVIAPLSRKETAPMDMLLSLNKDFYWPPIGAYGAVCIRDAIRHMLKTEKICAVSKLGEKSTFDEEIPCGVYQGLLEFFPPLIMHFERIAYPESRSKIPPPNPDIMESAIRFGKIIARVNPIIGLLREGPNRYAMYARELMVWCSKAYAFLEHIPLEKRAHKELLPWEKDFLPELEKFFEILHQQEENSMRPYV